MSLQHVMNARAPKWTPAQTSKARDLWLEGKSARYIGREVGRTRNAVIGHANRRCWPLHRTCRWAGQTDD